MGFSESLAIKPPTMKGSLAPSVGFDFSNGKSWGGRKDDAILTHDALILSEPAETAALICRETSDPSLLIRGRR